MTWKTCLRLLFLFIFAGFAWPQGEGPSSAGQVIEDFESADAAANWTFSNGPEFPGAKGSFRVTAGAGRNGSAAGVLAFDFSGGGAYVEAYRLFDSPLTCDGVFFRFSSYPPGSALRIRLIDSANQTFQTSLQPRNEGSWILLGTLCGDADEHWGGPGDGVWRGGLSGVGIVVSRGVDFKNYGNKGSFVFDEIMTVSGRDLVIDPLGTDRLPPIFKGEVRRRLGVNNNAVTHFAFDPKHLDLAAAAGFGFIRAGLPWDWVEKKRGVYDFSAFDPEVAALAARRMGVLFILVNNNPLYYDGPEPYDWLWGIRTAEARAAFAKFAAAAASHYKNRDVLLEVWNEPNIAYFWRPAPNPVQYGLLASAVISAVEDTGLKLPVVVGSTSGVDLDFIEDIMGRSGLKKADLVSIHPYRATNPETFWPEASVAVEVVSRKTGRADLPVVSGEWGYSTVYFSGGTQAALKKQALYAARTILFNLLRGVERIVWYNLKNDGDDPKDAEHNFGLVENKTLKPKPAYNALKAFRDLFPAGEVNMSGVETHVRDVFGLAFTSSKGRLAALWTVNAATGRKVLLPASYAGAKCFDMYGKLLKPASEGGRVVLRLRESGGPVYIKK